MALIRDQIGIRHPGTTRSWDSKDSLLYAIGVGAGAGDPTKELELTTENSADVPQRALPTLANVLCGEIPPIGTFDWTQFFHAGEGFALHRPLPVAGRVTPTHVLAGIYDKGTGALVRSCTELADADTGELLCTTVSDFFIRGEGGFAGPPAPEDAWSVPASEPDRVVEYVTRPEQALIYRLSGDRNPLHSDPSFARAAGFDRPILHGMCTLGFTARALINGFADGDPDGLASMKVRFSRPVFPGETLRVAIWTDGDTARFRTYNGDGVVVIDRGTAARRR